MGMRTTSYQVRRSAWPVFLSFCGALSVLLSGCDKQLLSETRSSPDEGKRAARLSGEPVFKADYEVETVSIGRIESRDSKAAKSDIVFAEIGLQPRIERQKVNFQINGDGSYELTIQPLSPQRLDLLPPTVRKRASESVLSNRTVVRNNVATFYNSKGEEVGNSMFKAGRFDKLVVKVLESKGGDNSISNEIIGHPLITESQILKTAQEKGAVVKANGAVTEITFDLSKFSGEVDAQGESLSKMAVQYYDFDRHRLLGEKLLESSTDKLLYKSSIFYSSPEEGNQVSKIISETFDEDPRTGLRTKVTKQVFYSKMNIVVNQN